jgi:hypothetical protein
MGNYLPDHQRRFCISLKKIICLTGFQIRLSDKSTTIIVHRTISRAAYYDKAMSFSIMTAEQANSRPAYKMAASLLPEPAAKFSLLLKSEVEDRSGHG